MAALEPRVAILDETDSGLDIDALKVVADGVNAMRSDAPSSVNEWAIASLSAISQNRNPLVRRIRKLSDWKLAIPDRRLTHSALSHRGGAPHSHTLIIPIPTLIRTPQHALARAQSSATQRPKRRLLRDGNRELLQPARGKRHRRP